MSSPVDERRTFHVQEDQIHENSLSSDEGTFVQEGPSDSANNKLRVDTAYDDVATEKDVPIRTPSSRREQATRLEDDLLLLQAERVASRSTQGAEEGENNSLGRSRSRRTERVDEFDEATNPLHEVAAAYTPPERPNTKLAVFVKRVHQSSFIIRYFTYIAPLVVILLIPLLVGALAYPDSNVGGVKLMWFSIWLEIVWLTLWAGRLVSKALPAAVSVLASIFTNNEKKWRDMARQLEIPAALFFWWLGVEISFLPTMKNHHVDGNTATRGWERTVNKLIISAFVFTILNFIEKIIIQLIAMSFHKRTYADRIEINKFQIGSLTKLYAWSRSRITETDEAFPGKGER
ncbi:hypothetical protein N7470_001811 [Penicillium chermesinum]|nr:hypothetical protein N7470_001811 [Penicillium chermesinum]